jgi:hypothetical protein
MLTGIPYLLSPALASRICGLSPRAFRRLYLDTRRLIPQSGLFRDGTGRMFVCALDLQRELGRHLTLEEVQAADAQLQKKRDYMVQYRRRLNATI